MSIKAGPGSVVGREKTCLARGLGVDWERIIGGEKCGGMPASGFFVVFFSQ